MVAIIQSKIGNATKILIISIYLKTAITENSFEFANETVYENVFWWDFSLIKTNTRLAVNVYFLAGMQ